jgi:EmrB/QacA subfamily drug resistance transporter
MFMSDHDGMKQAAPAVIGRERGLVTLALMLAMAVAALEQTVVATAMPSIISDLRGFEIYAWVFSAYLLAATVTTPLYGKLADLWGRKRLLLFGLFLFGVGSILSGMAWSMPVLIAMRVVQGIGAGAVMPIVLTILGDLFTLSERARVQGWFSGVWGVSSIAGPALGGLLTDKLSWRWVFYITIPFALFSGLVLVLFFRERVDRAERKPIDWPGAVLLAAGSTALLLGLLGDTGRGLGLTLFLLAAGVGILGVFVAWERRAADPVLPLDLLGTRTIGAAILGSFLIGLLLFGLDTYVPLYVQGVLGGSALDAGRLLTPLFLSWSISVAIAANVVVRFGFRGTALLGTLLITLGVGALAAGSAFPGTAAAIFSTSMVVIGLGMGPTSLSHILAVQNSVEWNRRGVATGAVSFFRTIGGALGVAVLGALLSARTAVRLPAGTDVVAALRPETHGRLAPMALAQVRQALRLSLTELFTVLLALTGVGLLCAARLPRRALDASIPMHAGAEDKSLAPAALECPGMGVET